MNLTHKLGTLRKENQSQKVKIAGWVAKKRNLGELIFIDLRDTTGIVQIIIDRNNKNYDLINKVKNEYVLVVVGIVAIRTNVNDKIPTGEVEIKATNVNVINESKQLPLLIQDETDALEDTRLDYRYLDIRRVPLLNNLKLRHNITKSIRNFLDSNNFLDIETPILTKSTPEGARDYIVPSRVNKFTAYALPQSPQIYKSLLMIGGVDRYYQIAKCFRDEDLRADRQPEFTQIDIEMSFMSEEEIRQISEKMLKKVVLETKGINIEDKFPIMTYDNAILDYGIDKPDIRFDLKLKDVTHIFEKSELKVFANAEMIKMINVKGEANSYSRKQISEFEKIVKKNHAKGLAWLKMNDSLEGSISKFLSETEKNTLISEHNVKNGDLLLFVADTFEIVNQSLAILRNHLGKMLNLYDENELAFLWVVDWPMFEYDKDLNRYFAIHHPFTMPQEEKFNFEKPLKTRAKAYDIVLNGYELGGGSIRINTSSLQQDMFKLLGMEEKEYLENFGFLIEAYKYGAPYHGGIALGLDRLVMLLAGEESIRDVIAFPKNAKAKEQMIHSPSKVDPVQLADLSIKWFEK